MAEEYRLELQSNTAASILHQPALLSHYALKEGLTPTAARYRLLQVLSQHPEEASTDRKHSWGSDSQQQQHPAAPAVGHPHRHHQPQHNPNRPHPQAAHAQARAREDYAADAADAHPDYRLRHAGRAAQVHPYQPQAHRQPHPHPYRDAPDSDLSDTDTGESPLQPDDRTDSSSNLLNELAEHAALAHHWEQEQGQEAGELWGVVQGDEADEELLWGVEEADEQEQEQEHPEGRVSEEAEPDLGTEDGGEDRVQPDARVDGEEQELQEVELQDASDLEEL